MNLDLAICWRTYMCDWDGGISRRVENGCRALSLLRHEVGHGPRELRFVAVLTGSR